MGSCISAGWWPGGAQGDQGAVNCYEMAEEWVYEKLPPPSPVPTCLLHLAPTALKPTTDSARLQDTGEEEEGTRAPLTLHWEQSSLFCGAYTMLQSPGLPPATSSPMSCLLTIPFSSPRREEEERSFGEPLLCAKGCLRHFHYLVESLEP